VCVSRFSFLSILYLKTLFQVSDGRTAVNGELTRVRKKAFSILLKVELHHFTGENEKNYENPTSLAGPRIEFRIPT
jgi:hypothetical protein